MKFGSKFVDLTCPQVMAIVNTTPDSFYDGGRYFKDGQLDFSSALRRAAAAVKAGATFIDIGGESTRPGADPVSLQEELDRVLPLVELVCAELDVVVSVDTSSPEVMTEAAALGAGLINDVRALERPGALLAAAKTKLPVCLMHMQGMPQTMQEQPSYKDVVDEVSNYLSGRVAACAEVGIAQESIIVDPGFGFGKTDAHNVALFQHLEELKAFGPVLVGVSRKSMIGRLLDREVEDRMAGSLALAMLAIERGANIVRVHDVQETLDVVRLQQIIKNGL